jgi:hypothetical protein
MRNRAGAQSRLHIQRAQYCAKGTKAAPGDSQRTRPTFSSRGFSLPLCSQNEGSGYSHAGSTGTPVSSFWSAFQLTAARLAPAGIGDHADRIHTTGFESPRLSYAELVGLARGEYPPTGTPDVPISRAFVRRFLIHS